MSEIEKMYKNANVYINLCECAFKNLYDYCINYGQEGCTHPISEIMNGCKNCKLAEQNVKYYPPFTPEKQLELIKWLGKNKNGFNVFYDTSFNGKEKHYWCCADQYYEDFNYGCHKKEFTEALAELINDLWQDLSEEEKQQVKGILE